MAYDVAQLKTDIASILHGTTLNSIQNIDQLIFRGASELLEDVDPQETKRIVELASPLYDKVFDYPLPSDLKGNKIVDIRPQVRRNPGDRFSQQYNEDFDLSKDFSNSPSLTINFNNGIKTIRLQNNSLLPGILVNEGDSISQNGTWSLGGDAINLTEDNVNYASGSGSLKFDLTGATGVGFIENSTMSAVNLTRDFNQGSEFLFSFLPYIAGLTPFTSLDLFWGSSPTDYYSRSVTVNQALNAFENGWNLLDYTWVNAPTTGTPNPAAINYIRVTFNYNIGTPVPNVRIDSVNSRLGAIWEIEYYSKYLFKDLITGAFKETTTSDNDLINLDTETYMLLTNKCAHLAAQQNGGTDGYFDIQYYENQYIKSLRRYQGMYKSEIIKPQQRYYTVKGNNYRRWYGGRFW